jgi:hypothetical protein
MSDGTAAFNADQECPDGLGQQALDDYLFDVVRDEKGFALAVNTIDVIIDRVMAVARARLAA